MRTEHVFGDLRPFAQCHAATLVGRPDGGWLAAWFAGTREGHEDVAIWAATRRPRGASDGGGDGVETSAEPPPPLGPGAAWSAPRPIARVRAEAHWNPVLFSLDPSDEVLVLHFKVGERIRHWETWSQSSADAGESWTQAIPLVPGDRGGRGAVRAKPIRLASGDWLAGASLERKGRWDVFFDRSPDGRTGWRATPLVERDRRAFGGKGLIQPTLWESRPGHVHALLRSTDGRVHRSDSDDDGDTWSPAYPTALPNNNSGLDVARLADGRLALACNPVPGNWAARTPLSVLFSEDNGATWPTRVDVETEPGEFSYPALVARGDRLALAYTWNRRRIAFAEPTPPD